MKYTKYKSDKHVCTVSGSNKYKFPFKTFSHAGLSKVDNKNSFLYQCNKCSLIFRKNNNLKKKLNKLFFSNQYTSKRFSSHISSNTIGKENSSHYNAIAEIISKRINFIPKKILDIGCYDGRLLNAISKKYNKTEFYGYDLSPSIKKMFKKNCNFNFIDNLDKLNQKFDLITCVNTLQYVPNNQHLIDNIKKLLDKNGKLFFLHIFLDNNPYIINHGDQYTYFTKNNFFNFLRLNGFDGKIITNSKQFPRNLIGIFNQSHKKFKLLKSKKISFFINFLKKAQNKLYNKNLRQINIFGSTINAKFVFEIMKSKTKKITFVDENPFKTNKKLFHKKIIHPKMLKNNSLLVIPYSHTSNQIISKLKKKYKLKYLKL